MFCPECGKELPDGARFCDACGTKIEQAPQAPVAGENVHYAPQNEDTGNYGPQPGTSGNYAPGPAPGWNPTPEQSWNPGPEQNWQQQSLYGDPEPFNPTVHAVKRGVASPAVLITVLCLMVMAAISLYMTINAGSMVMRYGEREIGLAMICVSLVCAIPVILMVIGGWMMWGTANGSARYISGTGMVKGAAITYAVVIGIAMLGAAIALIIDLSRLHDVQTAYNSFYGGGSNPMSQQFAAALIAGLLTIGILALYLVYFIKLAGLMNTIQEASVSGFCRGRVPGFLSGMNIITAVLILVALIGVLALRQEFLEALYGDASAVYFGRMLTSQYSLMIFQLVLALVLLISFTVALSVLKRRLLEAQTFYIR